MRKQMIRSVRELVDVLGGTFETAKLLQIVPSAVSNWLAQDYIPRGHHLELYLVAKQRGFRIDVTIFGLDRKLAAGDRSEGAAA